MLQNTGSKLHDSHLHGNVQANRPNIAAANKILWPNRCLRHRKCEALENVVVKIKLTIRRTRWHLEREGALLLEGMRAAELLMQAGLKVAVGRRAWEGGGCGGGWGIEGSDCVTICHQGSPWSHRTRLVSQCHGGSRRDGERWNVWVGTECSGGDGRGGRQKGLQMLIAQRH